jgi:hypothetical protein
VRLTGDQKQALLGKLCRQIVFIVGDKGAFDLLFLQINCRIFKLLHSNASVKNFLT